MLLYPILFIASILSWTALLYQIRQVVSIPFVSTNCYRFYGSPISQTIIHNKNVNVSLIDKYYALWGAPKKIRFNDTQVLFYPPNPIDSVLNRDVSVCSNDTFLLMMFPIRRDDSALRQVLRRAIPQGIVIQGKRINRIFVVAVADNERDAMKRVRLEQELYGDIIISRHSDAYEKTHLSQWDGYFWVREHCRSATFTGKFDSDAIHFLGNYVSLLLQYPTKRFYGGHRSGMRTFAARRKSLPTTVFSVPYDYPYVRRFMHVSGAAIIMSVDVIDYLMIGTMYEPYFMLAEDVMTGLVLDRMGIKPVHMGTDRCHYLVLDYRWYCGGRYKRLSNLPSCLCCYHGFKNLSDYNNALAFFGSRLYTSQLTDRVKGSRPIPRFRC